MLTIKAEIPHKNICFYYFYDIIITITTREGGGGAQTLKTVDVLFKRGMMDALEKQRVHHVTSS